MPPRSPKSPQLARRVRRAPLRPVAFWLQSHASLLRGTASSAALVAQLARFGYDTCLVADRDNLYAVVETQRAAAAAGLRCLVGAELAESCPGGASAVLIARDNAGYAALCELITRRKLAELEGGRGAAPSFDLAAALTPLPRGLFVLTASTALAQTLVAAGDPRRLREHLFLVLERPARTLAAELRVCAAADTLGLSLVAARATPFLDAAREAPVHRLLTAIRRLETVRHLDESELTPPSHALVPPAALAALYRDQPAALAATAHIAAACSFQFPRHTPIFPRFPLPAGETPYGTLYERCHAGLRRRYPHSVPAAAVERLVHELSVIRSMGFLEYFLVVGDIVAYAHTHGIECAGRGSGAGSMVAYALGITPVDPLRHHLYFERFLHPGRRDLPDLDIDLCWIGRARVIEAVYERYGRDRVAMISTHPAFQPRSAFRETARAYGVPPALIDRIARRIPHHLEGSLAALLAGEAVFDGVALAPPERQLLLAQAEALRGLPHHLSVHPGGIVIGDRPLAQLVPLERAAGGLVITQLDMYSIEEVGLVKIDLLGNRCLSEIAETCAHVEARTGVRPDLERLSGHDARTARLLAAGRTLGCFQLESPAMRALLVRLGARDLATTIHAVALVRPGPSEGGMKDRFIRRARGQEPAAPPHPALAELLAPQHGILLYEEDVMCVAATLTGMSLAQGDDLRRAIKQLTLRGDAVGLEALADRFAARAGTHGVPASQARDIWEQLARFGRYAFNKAHAASFGVLAYRSAYLKAHHPQAFFCALFNHHAGMYPFAALVAEARRCRVPVLLPCVNRSAACFVPEADGIRTPLARVKGLSARAIESLLAARPFVDLGDALARARLTRPELEDLILVGALDFSARPRPVLLWQARTLPTPARGQPPTGTLTGCEVDAPPLAELSLARRVAEELRLLGAGLSCHPLHFVCARRAHAGCCPLAEVPRHLGQRVRVAGLRIASRRLTTRRGQHMAFVTIEDETGLAELTLFPAEWTRHRNELFRDGPLQAEGRVEEQDGAIGIRVQRLEVWAT